MVAAFQEAFPGSTVLVTAVSDPDSRPHGANESLHLGDLERACVAEALMLEGVRRAAIEVEAGRWGTRSSRTAERGSSRREETSRVLGSAPARRARSACATHRTMRARSGDLAGRR